MSLKEYHRKRNFKRTPEPKGKTSAAKKRAQKLMYVIQKHAASHLHYDFRLELDGTLKSWAVPKGPSLNTDDKRLAVHVEDHPLEYGDFEGIIPEGQYGGGTVMVWDTGEWLPEGDPKEGYRAGKLHFTLKGKKLKGEWVLARMMGGAGAAGKNWLLMKVNDKYASKDMDITDQKPNSALSRKTLEQIKKSKKTWSSNRK